MNSSIAKGKAQDAIVTGLSLPPLLWSDKQVYSFSLPDGTPNYISQHTCTAPVVSLPSEDEIRGKIVLILGADPGYDWIFSHDIAGFITAYGGANSHMAIRAAEFDLPAVIGVGEKQFSQFTRANSLRVDCRNRTVHIL